VRSFLFSANARRLGIYRVHRFVTNGSIKTNSSGNAVLCLRRNQQLSY
jgi:hypothetical protein